MKIDGEQTDFTDRSPTVSEARRAIPFRERCAIAYSMDALVPGMYFWCGKVAIRIGGSSAETDYPGTIHSFAGAALVLPGYRIYSTYQGSYDPR